MCGLSLEVPLGRRSFGLRFDSVLHVPVKEMEFTGVSTVAGIADWLIIRDGIWVIYAGTGKMLVILLISCDVHADTERL